MGAWNTLQQSDGHAYWEFNYTTNWIHPLYELPFTGGIPGTFEKGQVGALQPIVPESGPNGIKNDPVTYGDNPNNKGVLQATGPRDPDKFDAGDDSQREFRQRFIPSGLTNEIFLDVYERRASFEPGVTDFDTRLFDAYAAEVARVDVNHDGVVSAAEGDVDTASDGFSDNSSTVHSLYPVQSLCNHARNKRWIACPPVCSLSKGLGDVGVAGVSESPRARLPGRR
jgi:hypothetical protein